MGCGHGKCESSAAGGTHRYHQPDSHSGTVYLFGSYAYGTPNGDSDLDLYVVIPDGSIPPAEAVKRIRRTLYPVQDMPMDVVACRASIFRQRQQGPSLERTVARKGVLLYGQPEPEQRMA